MQVEDATADSKHESESEEAPLAANEAPMVHSVPEENDDEKEPVTQRPPVAISSTTGQLIL